MIKRFKNSRSWRRSDEDGWRADDRPRRLFGLRSRWRSLGVLAVLLVSVIFALLALDFASGGTGSIGEYLSALSGKTSPSSDGEPPAPEEAPAPEEGPIPEFVAGQLEDTPEGLTYGAVAAEIPGITPDSIKGVYKSKLDPAWASVRVEGPDDEGVYVLFLKREGETWTALKSIRADEPEYPEYENVVLDGVPEDLVGSVYPQNAATAEPSGLLIEPVEPGSLPSVESAEAPTAGAVADEVPEEERERVEEGLEEARKTIEEYGTAHGGTAGVYVQDLEGGWGYGVNPDETFFSASVIKIPIMIAVYRRIDEGRFSLKEEFATAPEDWAAGAGTLQFQEAGGYHTVEEYLRVMMTQSDNVATNTLTRLVGGPKYVNAVAASLGAPHTTLYQEVTSERAAVPLLDNRTTPRDMSTILGSVYTGQAASPESCQAMVDLMRQNDLQSSLKDGLPKGTKVANKGGWLYKVYAEAGIVAHEDNPYVIAIFSKHGSADVEEGKALLKGISESAWQAQGS